MVGKEAGRAMTASGESASEVFLGVDGGSSGTRALVVDRQARALGYGEGGNANHAGIGYDRAVTHVWTAAAQACAAAGIAPECLTLSDFALAGTDTIDDERALGSRIGNLLHAGRWALSNDVWAGLRAGSISGIGVAVNCGSGCGAVGRNADNRYEMIPDLGYIYGDSGGGVQIGRDAVRAVVRAWDGRGEPTALTGPILALAGQPDVASLYLALYREAVPNDMLRRATRLVFTVAAEGDAVALRILHGIGYELGLSGAALARRLGMETAEFTFVLTGGTFRTLDSPLAHATIARMRETAPLCRPTLPLVQPVAAAALLALDRAGYPVDESHYLRLQEQGYGWHPSERY